MDIKTFLSVFFSIFIAELGDKTQLATFSFAANKDISKWWVFTASASALVCASALGVVAGNYLSAFIDPKYLKYGAGLLFIALGLWTLFKS